MGLKDLFTNNFPSCWKLKLKVKGLLLNNLIAFYIFFYLNNNYILCRGCFCNKGRKCENSPNLPLSSLEVFIEENQAQNFKCIMNKRLIVFWQEKIKILITKVQKKYKNITGLKLRPTVSEKRKLREVVKKRGKIPLYPYFHP